MSDKKDFSARLSSLGDAKVLCVGDIMLDCFIYGSVERISPEGPIPVLRIEREQNMLGGVGNVVANLAALGAGVKVVAAIGKDTAGDKVRSRLQDLIGDDSGLLIKQKRPTTIKTRYLASNQQLLRTDCESREVLSEKAQEKIITLVLEALPEADVLVLSDYGKGVLTDHVLRRLIDAANDQGKPVVVDPKGNDYSRYKGASIVTPNRKELEEASRMPTEDAEEVVSAARHIIEEAGIQSVVATRSADGMSIVTCEDDPVHLPTEAQDVFDVSGAGDTVVATIAAAMAAGADLEEAAALANIAAGIVVGKVGTAVVHLVELDTVLRETDRLERMYQGKGAARVMTLEQAIDQVGRWRARKLKVGFTNGCFDLLHPGHISLLNQARERCDRLIVGLNSDESVRGLKGPSRPAQDEAARSAVLGSIASVDMIIVFGDETPIKLIEGLSPDVLVKGADYTVETVVGSEHVLSYGGEVFLAELQDGHSTTNTLEKLAANQD